MRLTASVQNIPLKLSELQETSMAPWAVQMKGSHHFTEETDMQKPNGERRKLPSGGMKENTSFGYNQNYEGKTQELKPTKFSPIGH